MLASLTRLTWVHNRGKYVEDRPKMDIVLVRLLKFVSAARSHFPPLTPSRYSRNNFPMSTTVVPLGSLASAIVAEAPALLQRSINYELESNMLHTQCSVLKGRLEIVKRSIANERDKQQVLMKRLTAIQGGIKNAGGSLPDLPSPSIEWFSDHNWFFERCTFAYHVDSPPSQQHIGNVQDANSTISDGSPVSLRTKRKGMILDEDSKVAKRLKLLA
ncbi:hypothetical protein NM688_g198 [Phlebia brevispora]|uniref:Uncharacterized protein n=1 Tax=Phlebia brevispora TaxID=194682 RepID=A0ACC1TEN4_9APHY|nr:hypothetical protein NM688_g198 [Phlebia brevispora]